MKPGAIIKKNAPKRGPNTVPAPPITIIATAKIENNRLNVPGYPPPEIVDAIAPPTPA